MMGWQSWSGGSLLHHREGIFLRNGIFPPNGADGMEGFS